MHAPEGIKSYGERYDISYQQTPTSPLRTSNTSVSCNETPSLHIAPATTAKQRISLISRLKTVGPVARPYSRSPSLSSVSLTDTSSCRYSYDWRLHDPSALPHGRPESAARSILSRGGRMLKRQGSKFSLASFLLEEEPKNSNMEVSETCQRPQQSQKKSKGVSTRKKAISLPFDFHHVTHTGPRHFERLDRGSQNELITEFVAIRAAQRPKSTLQGIQADDLCNATHVKYSAAGVQRNSSAINNPRLVAGHRDVPVSVQRPPTSPEYPRTIRSSPSIENFSRPAPWSPKSPTSPPPRTSSRNALDCSSRPAEATSKSATQTSGKPDAALLTDTKLTLHSRAPANDPHLPASQAITTIVGSTRPLRISTVQTRSRGTISGPTTDTSTQAEHVVRADIGTLTTLPLRHVCSFPTTKLLSQQHRHYLSKDDRHSTETGPEPLAPNSISQWEDVVDYSYEQAAESDCNFDWSQKTVYVDGDLESTGAPASESESIGELSARNDEQPQASENRESRAGSGAFHPRHVATQNNIHPRHISQKSVKGLEDCLSSFAGHQSSSGFRGYQHLARTPSKPTSDLNVSLDGPRVNDDAYLQKEACDGTVLELPAEQSATLERCSSGESSTFGLRPLLNKYSSDGSLLSSTTSTIRTYRSSNSVGSLPELIYSLNNSRENVVGEKTSPTETVSSGSHPFPPRLPSAPRSQLQLEKTTAKPAKDAASELPSMSPTSPIMLPEVMYEPVGKLERADFNKAKTGATTVRKRSASAVTPGQYHGSYSLFPTQQSPNRRL